jgi:sugar/nucleoside kinase (ribokinase family)
VLRKGGLDPEGITGAARGGFPEGPLAVETLGSDGGRLYTGGVTYAWQAARSTGPITEEIGCGDAFAGALLYALFSGETIAEGVALAAKVAAKVAGVALCRV